MELGLARRCAPRARVSRHVLLAAVCAIGAGRLHPRRPAERWPGTARRHGRVRIHRRPAARPIPQLVQALNNEAQTRRLAVMSRESPSAYRVRGYLAAKVVQAQTTISWVWDVFDRDEQRALRISGEETANRIGRHRDAWTAADDAMLRRIARSSMDQLAAFLTSPEVAPSTPDVAEPRMALRRRTAISRRKRPAFSAFSRPMPIRRRPTPLSVPRGRRRRSGPAAAPPAGAPAAMSARETLTQAACESLSQRRVHPVQKLAGQRSRTVLPSPCPALL